MGNKQLNVVVFRNNLRVQDNEALYNALKEKENIICIYSLEILKGRNYDFKKCGDFRKRFIYQSILEIKEKLESKNISLYCVNSINETLTNLSKDWNLKIFYEKEVGVEEHYFETILEEFACESYLNQTLIEAFEFDIT